MNYPFTAPAVIPAMKERWKKRYMMTIGIDATKIAVLTTVIDQD
jgi:hypothetical protein